MGLISWINRILNFDPSVYKPKGEDSKTVGMNEGDLRSGPGGYSPSTGYPESFYGSGGDSDRSHGSNEGDFNRKS